MSQAGAVIGEPLVLPGSRRGKFVKKLCFVLSALAAAGIGLVVVPGMAGADPSPSPVDTVKNAPAPPEAPVTLPVTMEEAVHRLNPDNLKNVRITQNEDGTLQVSIYRMVDDDATPPPVPPGGYEAYDEEHQ
jgi:hypothetical protein